MLKGIGGVDQLKILYTEAGETEAKDFTDAFNAAFEGYEISGFGMI